MKIKILFCIATLFLHVILFGQRTNSSHTRVNGYFRSNGTYIQPHYRTTPNSTNRDNFSTQGNTNPYTGKPGLVIPDNKPVATNENYNYQSPSSYFLFPTSTSEKDKPKSELELIFEKSYLTSPNTTNNNQLIDIFNQPNHSSA